METRSDYYEVLVANPRFRALVRHKRAVSLVLFGISMVLFFSIPLITSYSPEFFKVRIFGEANMGLAWIILQYIAGGVVAWKYAVLFSRVDKEMAALVSELIRKS